MLILPETNIDIMNLQQIKPQYKAAYTVMDAAYVRNYGEVIIYHNTIKETNNEIHCRSNKGMAVLYDKKSKKLAEIVKYRVDRESLGERAIALLNQIVGSHDINREIVDNLFGESIMVEAREITGYANN